MFRKIQIFELRNSGFWIIYFLVRFSPLSVTRFPNFLFYDLSFRWHTSRPRRNHRSPVKSCDVSHDRFQTPRIVPYFCNCFTLWTSTLPNESLNLCKAPSPTIESLNLRGGKPNLTGLELRFSTCLHFSILDWAQYLKSYLMALVWQLWVKVRDKG